MKQIICHNQKEFDEAAKVDDALIILQDTTELIVIKVRLQENSYAVLRGNSSGNYGAASATGYQGAASVKGQNSVAMAIGMKGKAAGALGCWISLAEWKKDKNGDWNIKCVKTAKVDGKKIKADTFYTLKNTRFVEAP